ncbi:MAG: short-chain dehydrogenase, partial [Desulfuromonadaceae bacterium]|nr:short-chain dehydrogenase [Desulfuromonadaceae bacterium]
GILKGLAANERVVFVTDADRDGAVNSTRPEAAAAMDEYLLGVARRRRSGESGAL